MSIVWSFKIELLDINIFQKYQEEYNIVIPAELVNFIIECNGASPDKECILINGNVRVVSSVLSFNEKETEATTFEYVFNQLNNKSIIPFASDPFGNYYCYSVENGLIVFYHHEEDIFEETVYTLEKFLDNLRE